MNKYTTFQAFITNITLTKYDYNPKKHICFLLVFKYKYLYIILKIQNVLYNR